MQSHTMVQNMKNLQLLGSSTIGTRGQITIPKKAREEFDLNPGDVILFVKEAGQLVLKERI
jgi:AbrB family looped-hinge helix DNA binding protein